MTQPQEIRLESLADGPGLLPYKLGPTRLTTHHHSFVQYIQLNDIEDKVNVLQTQLDSLSTKLINDTYLLYEAQIHYLTNKLGKVSSQLKSLEPNRAKRGLVDSLGSVIKSITGNLDYSDAIKFNDAIQSLQNNQDKVVTQFNNHVSLSKEWMTRHSNVLQQLVDNQSKINATLSLLLDSDAYRDSSLIKYARFGQLLDIMGDNIDDLMSELTRIENSLAFIRASSTHHSMISIDVLSSMIDKLKSIYSRDQILDLELREYYDVIKSGSYYSGRQVVIVFRFPIVSSDTYDLYKLSIVPNKNHQALIPSHPFIATSKDAFVYMEAECPKLSTWYLCEKDIGRQLRTQPDCVQELILHQNLEESCHFTTVLLSREAMEKLDDQHYVLSFPQPTKVQLVCGREDFSSIEGSYLITIPVSCYLRTKEFTITNENDEIKGQPLKLTKIPYDSDKQVDAARKIQLNTIDLQGLHSIQDQIILQPPLKTEKSYQDTLYHTTIPFYVVILIGGALITAIASHRYGCWSCKEPKKLEPPTDKKHTYEDIEKKDEPYPKGRFPATFSLNVLK